MKKAEQIAKYEPGLLARSDPYQPRVGFTAKQLQEKEDARLAKELKKTTTQAKADRKLAKQLRRASTATEDPYYEEPQTQTKPARRLGKSNKDITARQARIATRRQSDARLQRQLQQLQGGFPTRSTASKKTVPFSKHTTQFTIASPSQGKKRPVLPIQDIARAFAQANKKGRFDSTLSRGNMLIDLLDDIP